MPGGRKGFGEELKIKERYAVLTEPFFKVLQDFLNSDDKNDRRFAAQELNKAFVKMIPTQLTGEEGEAIKITVEVAKSVAEKHDLAPDTGRDSEGQA